MALRRLISNWKYGEVFKNRFPEAYDLYFEYTTHKCDLPLINGPNLEEVQDIETLLESYESIGIQASIFSNVVAEINKMLHWRLSDEELLPSDKIQDMSERRRTKCTVFLGHTSIVLTSGLREIIRYLVQNKLVDVVVCTAGGIEEDIMKCMMPFRLGDFNMPGYELRKKGWNRNGNIIVETDSYIEMANRMLPVLDTMLEEQNSKGVNWTPSKLIARLALELGNETSVCYWAAKNNIPIFCPPIVDGGIGENLFIHSIGNHGLKLDILEDHEKLYDIERESHKTGAVLIGGSVSKHMVLNAQRKGLDHAVYINTAQEFDGSDAGARPDEAVSWGEIKLTSKPVKLFAEASLVFPLIAAKTFVPYLKKIRNGEILV